MTAPQPPVSLREHVAVFTAGAHVLGLGWAKAVLMAAMADGEVLLREGAAVTPLAAHPNAGIIAATATTEGLLTGGDDGRVVWCRPGEAPLEMVKDAKRRWINAVACRAGGKGDVAKREVAWSAGREIGFRDAKGKLSHITLPATGEAIAFAPKGLRLAVATYNGVTLWYPGTEIAPEFLEWKGSHIGVIWSPDGRFVVSVMQENALHGWRLGVKGDKPGHMRMTGYAAKPRSLSWSHDGQWLASSGADAAIIWPFQGDGPMGKAPRECGIRRSRVASVAFHPHAYVLAAGYEDGCILMIRLTDASELLVRPAVPGSGITALAWDTAGKRLAFGCVDGAAGVLTLPA
jgi:WD domain, G-beta repeat